MNNLNKLNTMSWIFLPLSIICIFQASYCNIVPSPISGIQKYTRNQGDNISLLWDVKDYGNPTEHERFYFLQRQKIIADYIPDKLKFTVRGNHLKKKVFFQKKNTETIGLSLMDLNLASSGSYQCVYDPGESHSTNFTSPAIVIVIRGRPTTPKITTTVSENGSLTLMCTSSCTSEPRDYCQPLLVTWYINGTRDSQQTNETNHVIVDGNYSNMTSYQCDAVEKGSTILSNRSEEYFIQDLEIIRTSALPEFVSNSGNDEFYGNVTISGEVENQWEVTVDGWLLWIIIGTGIFICVMIIIILVKCIRHSKRSTEKNPIEISRQDILRTQWEDGVLRLSPLTQQTNEDQYVSVDPESFAHRENPDYEP